MDNKAPNFYFLISFLIVMALSAGDIWAQLDLNKLSEKKSLNESSISKRDEFFNSMKKQILLEPTSSMITLYHLNMEKHVKSILKDDYGVKFPSECFDLDSNAVKVIDRITSYYQAENFMPGSAHQEKERLAKDIEYMKSYAISGRGGRCQASSELPKIINFIEDYNKLASLAFQEAKMKQREEEELREKKAKKEEEFRILREKENEREREEAYLKSQREIAAKFGPIIKYAKANRVRLEKESKSFCEDISGVWYAEGDYFSIDLVSSKIVTISNNRPFHVQIGKFDKDKNYLIAYVTKDGEISIGDDGKPVGFFFRKVVFGGNEFKLGMGMTDGIENGQETILGWVRKLK